MTVQDDILELRAWWAGARHDPVTWTVLLSPLFFAFLVFAPVVLVRTVAPPNTLVSTVVHASHGHLQQGGISEPKLFCKANGHHYLAGYKNVFGGPDLNAKEASVCWDMRETRWVWEFREKALSYLNSP